MDFRWLEDLKHELSAVKMHHSVDGHGKFQFDEHHSLDFPVRIDAVEQLLMKIGLLPLDIALMSRFFRVLVLEFDHFRFFFSIRFQFINVTNSHTSW